MMRSRNIKPGLFTNAELASGGAHVQITFAGLWCLADREGRLEDRPSQIKGEIMRYYDTDMAQNLEYLSTHLDDDGDPFIIRYTVDGKRYIQVTKFAKHQIPHQREAASVIPAPADWVRPAKDHPKKRQPDTQSPDLDNPRDSQGLSKDNPTSSQGTVMSALESLNPGYANTGGGTKYETNACAREEAPPPVSPQPSVASIPLTIPADLTPARLPHLHRLTAYTLQEFNKLVYPPSVTIDQMRAIEKELALLDEDAKTVNPEENFLSALRPYILQYDDGFRQANYLKSEVARCVRFARQDYSDKAARVKKRAPAVEPEAAYTHPEPPPEYDQFIDGGVRWSGAKKRGQG